MDPILLLQPDDRPERGGWIYSPSAPTTEEQLNEFFAEIEELLSEQRRDSNE